MTYPSYSYLTPATIGMALQLARELRQAAADLGRLTSGAAVAYNYSGGGGRVADKAVAVQDWIGPHRDTFESLFDNEMDSARTTGIRLGEEADAWARFWATAINARNDRLHDEALDRYRDNMGTYQSLVQDYHDAVDEDPQMQELLSLPSPPSAPSRPSPVTVPTAASGYQPTG